MDVRPALRLAQRVRLDPRARQPAPSAVAPPTSTSRPAAATCPARWSSRPAGAPRPAGSSSATSCSIGPWRHDDDLLARPTAARPTDYEAEHILLRTDPVRLGRGPDGHGLRAGLRLRPRDRLSGSYTGTSYHQGRATAAGSDVRDDPHHRHAAGVRGRSGRRPARLLKEGDVRFVALSWGEAEPPHDY